MQSIGTEVSVELATVKAPGQDGRMPLVAGIDCSTQSMKVLVCDAGSGAIVRTGTAPHPDVTEIDPALWWEAFEVASAGLLDDVRAIAVGGQQHGMVALDEAGSVVRPALLWNDTRSAAAATALVQELGGPASWAKAAGSVPVASFTVTKLRWFAEAEPDLAARTAAVALPHDWLTWRLAGGTGIDSLVTDRGDASGTGYWSPTAEAWAPELLRLAFGAAPVLPRIAAPAERVGSCRPDGRHSIPMVRSQARSRGDAVLAAGTGDNMAAALGLGIGPGDVVVSLGTSGTAFAAGTAPTADASGAVAGFADATGGFLPLVCTLNAARVLGAAGSLVGTDLAGVDDLALSVPDSGGLVLLPYLDGERTPDLPDARGLLHGLTRRNAAPGYLARAAVEGMLCGLADGIDALRRQGVPVRRVLLIGGAARSRAVQTLAPGLFDADVVVPEPLEYVARGAARQAAWALSEAVDPPDWPVRTDPARADSWPPSRPESAPAGGAVPTRYPDGSAVRARYGEVRDAALPLLGR